MPRKRKTPSPIIGAELLRSKFFVNNTPKAFHTDAVEKIMDKAIPLLKTQKGAEAEPLLRKALTLEPIMPDLLYHLAMALELQGLKEDWLCINETILILFPDYLFTRTALAHAAITDYDYEDALVLLTPLFSLREFHFSEYNSLCAALIDLSLLRKQYHSVRLWFDKWSQPDATNPKLSYYRELLKKLNA